MCRIRAYPFCFSPKDPRAFVSGLVYNAGGKGCQIMAEKNYLIFSSRIKEAYGSLAKKERRIADYLLQNPESVLNATAKEIAEATDSSAATVITLDGENAAVQRSSASAAPAALTV